MPKVKWKQGHGLILKAVDEQEAVICDPASLVLSEGFDDSALIFNAYFWIDTNKDKDLRIIRSNIRFRIDELFEQHNMVIAFPQRNIHVDGKLHLIRNVSYRINT